MLLSKQQIEERREMSENIRCGIYLIRNKVNSKVYVGCSINCVRRFGEHLCSLKINKHHSYLLQRSFNKHGLGNFEFEIIEEVQFEKDLSAREKYYLDLYESYSSFKGYNICSLGNSMIGVKRSEETRKRLSLIRKGRKLTEEHKQHIRLSCKGQKRKPEFGKMISEMKKGKKLNLSQEQRMKLSESLRGRILSNEHKEKISKALRGIQRPEEYRKNLSEALKVAYFNPQLREKISNIKKGKKFLETHRINIGLAKRGTKMSSESILRRIASNTGRRRSEESKQRMRDAWVIRKQKNAIKQENYN